MTRNFTIGTKLVSRIFKQSLQDLLSTFISSSFLTGRAAATSTTRSVGGHLKKLKKVLRKRRWKRGKEFWDQMCTGKKSKREKKKRREWEKKLCLDKKQKKIQETFTPCEIKVVCVGVSRQDTV